MTNSRSRKRLPGLLFALEMLDDMVRKTSIGPSYVDTTMHQAVLDAIRRAKKRSQPKDIMPRTDQMPLTLP